MLCILKCHLDANMICVCVITKITIKNPHTQQQKLQIEKIKRRAARYVSNRYHDTSSVTDMMSDLNWAPLEVCRIRYRLIFFYKVIHHLVAIPYSNLLIPVDTRTRHTNPNSFRHIQTSKDCYKLILILPEVYHTLESTAYNIYNCRHS